LFKTFLVFLQCRLNETTLLFADSGHQDGTYIMERRLPTFCLWRIWISQIRTCSQRRGNK